jgi:hypothetical protein
MASKRKSRDAAIRWLGEYWETGKRRKGRPPTGVVVSLRDLYMGDTVRLPRRVGRPQTYTDAELREWIGVVDRAKKHFGLKSDRAAVEKIEEDLRRGARGRQDVMRARITKIVVELSRARARMRRRETGA